MSEILHDLRAKITTETNAALEAEHRATGKDRSEIVRDLLHAWAIQKIDAANVMHSLLISEGLTGIGSGRHGSGRA